MFERDREYIKGNTMTNTNKNCLEVFWKTWQKILLDEILYTENNKKKIVINNNILYYAHPYSNKKNKLNFLNLGGLNIKVIFKDDTYLETNNLEKISEIPKKYRKTFENNVKYFIIG